METEKAKVGISTVTTIEKRAVDLLSAFERAGKTVSRVTIDGKKIEIELSETTAPDEFDRIEMRHDKT